MSDRSKQGRALPAEVVRRCLINKPETGMGYQTGNVVLSNGQIMCDVAFVDGEIVEVRGAFRYSVRRG